MRPVASLRCRAVRRSPRLAPPSGAFTPRSCRPRRAGARCLRRAGGRCRAPSPATARRPASALAVDLTTGETLSRATRTPRGSPRRSRSSSRRRPRCAASGPTRALATTVVRATATLDADGRLERRPLPRRRRRPDARRARASPASRAQVRDAGVRRVSGSRPRRRVALRRPARRPSHRRRLRLRHRRRARRPDAEPRLLGTAGRARRSPPRARFAQRPARRRRPRGGQHAAPASAPADGAELAARALAADARPRPADQRPVGQLRRRDAAQGPRRRLRPAGTTAAGAAVVAAHDGRARGRPPAVADGSGLSRANRATPRQVVAPARGDARPSEVATPSSGSLAVAGRTGTLRNRLRGTAAQDRCRAQDGHAQRRQRASPGSAATASGHTIALRDPHERRHANLSRAHARAGPRRRGARSPAVITDVASGRTRCRSGGRVQRATWLRRSRRGQRLAGRASTPRSSGGVRASTPVRPQAAAAPTPARGRPSIASSANVTSRRTPCAGA